MSIATTDEQAAIQQSIRSWAGTVRTLDVVRGREPGREVPTDEAGIWAGLAGLGVLGMALPEELGGAGGGIGDAAAALEQAATALVPGPVLPSLLAGLLVARFADPVVAKRLIPRLADGSRPGAVALGPASVRAHVEPDGRLRVDGRSPAVLGADADSQLVLAARAGDEEVWFTIEPGWAHLESLPALDFSRPLADVTLTGVEVPAEQVLTGLTSAGVADLAAVLAGAEMVAVASWCLRTATDYARVREQFGRPIGSFQAVKHLCAQMLCRQEQAAAVVWDAARAADAAWSADAVGSADAAGVFGGDAGQVPLAAAVAAAIALDAAVENAKDCVQVLGGIGFTWEHDVHLYLRRALAQRQWLGGGRVWRRRVAELALAGGRRRLELALEADDAERRRIRAELTAIAALPTSQHRGELAEKGYLVPHWPPPHGQGATAGRQLLIDEEMRRAGLERPDLVIGGWALPTIIRHGTAAQQERFVRPTLRGEITWCQLFSEPEAGSDLASLRTRARRETGGWRLTGQKVWTSAAAQADWAICLARTDPDAPKHRGITYFLVDMRSPGLTVRPLKQITGDSHFNEVYLTDVFVPDEAVVGPVNEGWRLARTTLAEERVALGRGSALDETVERLLRLGSAGEDLDRIGALVSSGTAVAVLGLRSTARRLRGEETGATSAVLKLLGVQHRQAVAEAAYELLGPAAIGLDERTGPIAHELLLTRCLSIAGGTTQILLTQAAERLLGLPREPVG